MAFCLLLLLRHTASRYAWRRRRGCNHSPCCCRHPPSPRSCSSLISSFPSFCNPPPACLQGSHRWLVVVLAPSTSTNDHNKNSQRLLSLLLLFSSVIVLLLAWGALLARGSPCGGHWTTTTSIAMTRATNHLQIAPCCLIWCLLLLHPPLLLALAAFVCFPYTSGGGQRGCLSG